MTDKHQPLRDALKNAQSSDWSHDGDADVYETGVGILVASAMETEDAAYIAAANPAAISAILADLDAAKARLQWLIGQHWVEPEAVFRLNLSGTDDAAAYEQEAYAAIDAALSQIKAAGREG